MKNCEKSKIFRCHFPEKDCSICNIIEIEALNQMHPGPRTVGELITILSQYPKDTKMLGITRDDFLTDLLTVQGNCPDDELDNVMICYYRKEN